MSRLMRRAYGHGGTRLEHIIVCAPPMQSPPTPLWQKLPVVLLLLAIPVLVSRYAVPTAPLLTRTVIDISKLTVKPPPPPPKPVVPEPERIRPIERPVEPPPKPETITEQTAPKTVERRTVLPAPLEVSRPSIVRSSPANNTVDSNVQPRVVRERRQVDMPVGTSAATRLRREAVAGEAPSDKKTISRVRGVTALESSLSNERVAVLRRTTPVGELSAGASGNGLAKRPAAVRSGRSSALLEEDVPRVTTARERTKITGSGGSGDGESPASVGLARGVSLMSLEICASSRQQEEAIKAVLSVIGSRQNCRDEKGEFQFKGTKRVSSFNIMIFPSQGRKPSHRCEELENAYTCLKKH